MIVESRLPNETIALYVEALVDAEQRTYIDGRNRPDHNALICLDGPVTRENTTAIPNFHCAVHHRFAIYWFKIADLLMTIKASAHMKSLK